MTGEHLLINYHFTSSPFGEILIASTEKSVCFLAFVENKREAFRSFQERFPTATFQNKLDSIQKNALLSFTSGSSKFSEITFDLKGTEFQREVWRALLAIPLGQLSTYGAIAAAINRPKAYRAVGTAISNNPIAFLIPCHRVIQSMGALGNYRWGVERKRAILKWEKKLLGK